MEKNKVYIQMVLDRDELDKRTQQDKDQKNLEKRKDLQRFNKKSLGDSDEKGSVLSSNQKLSRARKAKLGGPMVLEEIRMNKSLL